LFIFSVNRYQVNYTLKIFKYNIQNTFKLEKLTVISDALPLEASCPNSKIWHGQSAAGYDSTNFHPPFFSGSKFV